MLLMLLCCERMALQGKLGFNLKFLELLKPSFNPKMLMTLNDDDPDDALTLNVLGNPGNPWGLDHLTLKSFNPKAKFLMLLCAVDIWLTGFGVSSWSCQNLLYSKC